MPRVITLTLNPALDLTVQVPQLRAGEVNHGQEPHWQAAGKGVNVASILADAGVSTIATGFLGRENAARFEELFTAKGIEDRFIRLSGITRLNLKLNDPAAQQTTDVNLPGLRVSAQDLAKLEGALLSLARPGDIVALCGSLPPGTEASLYAELIAKLRARGCVTVLDSSKAALLLAFPAGASILKPNQHELETALGRPLTDDRALIAAARELLKTGSELITVSQGERGALFITESEVRRARPPRVKVASSVGAGDAMVAGLIAARLRDLNLSDAARLATTYAAGTITRLGAHLPPAAELKRLAQEVCVEDGE